MEQNTMSEENKTKGGDGMYGNTPRVTIGGFTICDNGDGQTWIEQSDGEGGSFATAELEKAIKAFYNRNF
jgi:hypothetical protein